MNLENGNKESDQTFSEQRKPLPAPGVMSAVALMGRTLLTWIVVVITLFILFITWLFTIREKKDWTDKNRRQKLLLIISE